MTGELDLTARESRRAAMWLFLIGMFSMTQINIGGKLGISEFAMVACAPFVFIKNIPILRRDGSIGYFWLNLLWIVGAVTADVYSHNYPLFAMKGIAVPIALFADAVCIYVLLRKNLGNLKFLLLGIAVSGVVSIFIFQRGGAGDLAAESGLMAGAERVMSYKLFWTTQLTTWLTLPICGWYMKVKKGYSVVVVAFLAVFNLLTGGRSAFLVCVISCSLLALGGKTYKSLGFFKRHIVSLLIGLMLIGAVAKGVYKYAVVNGYMGEEEMRKYELQTRTNDKPGALTLLMSGRAEFFICLFAALDRPFVGNGSFPIDEHGYVTEFLSKYGTKEDYARALQRDSEYGMNLIPWHSHIATYWAWHGIFGLLFWLYVIVMVGKTLFLRIHVYPPWFGYFALMLPAFIWDILFSPLGLRVNTATLLVSILFVARLSRERSAMPLVVT